MTFGLVMCIYDTAMIFTAKIYAPYRISKYSELLKKKLPGVSVYPGPRNVYVFNIPADSEQEVKSLLEKLIPELGMENSGIVLRITKSGIYTRF